MAELEFAEVLKNAQLRHDIVFDDVLRFRPNLDGDRGERKRLIADRYWLAISQELERNCRCTAFLYKSSDRHLFELASSLELRRILPCVCSARANSSSHSSNLTKSTMLIKPGTIPLNRIPSRIPGLVEELRNILLSLVAPRPPPSTSCQPSSTSVQTDPSSSICTTSAHELINSTLDPSLISHNLERRTLDLADLAHFLGLVLKGHCAPMRDRIVEGMVSLISGTHPRFILEPDAPNAAHDSLQKLEYVGLAGGLRIAFELLELMKLDIANHQLRTLRPALLETALEFEIRHFRDQLAKRPSIEKTRRWFKNALARVGSSGPSQQVFLKGNCTSLHNISRIVREGLLELVFNAGLSTQHQSQWALLPILTQPVPGSSSPLSRSGSASSRFSRHLLTPSPSPHHIPETFLMDTIRLQNLHSDVTDLTIAYMLIMLFKQLVGHSNLRAGDVETLRSEIWVFMSELVMKVKHPERKTLPGIGLKKIELGLWRQALEDVLIHLAARVEKIRERSKNEQDGTRSGHSNHVSNSAPSMELVRTVKNWMQGHVKTDSTLFQLAHNRLRQTFELFIIQESLELVDPIGNHDGTEHEESGTGHGGRVPLTMRTGRTTMIEQEETLNQLMGNRRRPAGGLTQLTGPPRSPPPPSFKEEDHPLSHSHFQPQDDRKEQRKKIDEEIERAMKLNGLMELKSEVKIVSSRISKLMNYHLRGYSGLYEQLL